LFQEGAYALLYDSRIKHFKGKLMTRWLGPYVIEKCHDNGVVQIRTIDEENIPLLVNGYRLKAYKKPLQKEVFVSSINKEVMVIGRVSTSTSLNP